MKELAIVIWVICFPLATTLNRYFNDLIRSQRKEKVLPREVVKRTDLVEAVIFIGVLFYLIIYFK